MLAGTGELVGSLAFLGRAVWVVLGTAVAIVMGVASVTVMDLVMEPYTSLSSRVLDAKSK